MSNQMGQIAQKKCSADSVRKILGDVAYQRYLEQAALFTIFGTNLTDLDGDELRVAVVYLLSIHAQYSAPMERALEAIKSARKVLQEMEQVRGGKVITSSNPFKVGDWVRLGHELRDSYQEVWHDKGEVLQVVSIAEDGAGLMFHSQLGIHFSNAEPAKEPKDENQKSKKERSKGRAASTEKPEARAANLSRSSL